MWPRPAADFGGLADPATPAQYGLAARLFEKLGYADREIRLEAAAVLLGLDGLGSFRDLSKGKCGWLICHVGACTSPAELTAAVRVAAPLPPLFQVIALLIQRAHLRTRPAATSGSAQLR
jgi:hypothetical protein